MPSSAKHGYIYIQSLVLVLATIFLSNQCWIYSAHYEFMHPWSHIALCVFLAASVTVIYLINQPRPVYLIDFSCFKPDESCKYTREAFVERSITLGTFTGDNVLFQKKILERSGVGQATYFPEAIAKIPPDLRISEAMKEAEMVMFGAVGQLLEKTGIDVKAVDVVIVNCSLFSPTPSLSEMILNRYKFREDVVCYNLSGMGCSAGLISVDLAMQLLKVSSETTQFHI